MLLSYLITVLRISKVSNNDLIEPFNKLYLFLKINNLQSNDFIFIAAIKY